MNDRRLEFILALGATEPVRALDGDLGFDLYSNELVSFAPNDIKLVNTGVKCKFPTNIGGILKDRSSVASKRKMFIHAGVIDSNYRGEIKILFHNAGNEYQTFYPEDKIAQMVLVNVIEVGDSIIVDNFDDETTRSDRGFGSTGQ